MRTALITIGVVVLVVAWFGWPVALAVIIQPSSVPRMARDTWSLVRAAARRWKDRK